ncbi:MAG TPA: hypothetical protein VMX16_13390 [Terriglobia bacterium]|nr:hypothetical protein [Terriglobia bacterium]
MPGAAKRRVRGSGCERAISRLATTGYDIMLERCDPKLLKMEMDIFWVVYAGKDPLTYWRRYPGRFPLLHIKDMRRGVKINP